MLKRFDRPQIPLPRHWNPCVKSAVLHVISVAQFSLAYTRGWAANSINARIRLRAQCDRLRQENSLLREEMRIKDARMARIAPQRRPQYPPVERMAILELKAARGWSLRQAARAFLITPATVASWIKRIDEQGPDALVQLREPVNRFPDFVRYCVRRLKILCPAMGKAKIAETLARAGLHLGATTVGRILKEDDRPVMPTSPEETSSTDRVVTAKHPNHVWHVDLTVVPTAAGFWATWLPFSLPQRWPFCWWVAIVVDHFSRRAMGFSVFPDPPSSEQVRAFLGRTIAKAEAAPKYLVCDKGSQFWCDGFKTWCRRRGIRPRFGAIGKHGSIAVVERFIRTLKDQCTRCLLIPLQRKAFRRELQFFVEWYNLHRPHAWLGGRTPDEAYHHRRSANRQPRFEPRPYWPRPSPCAKPQTLVKGQPGVQLEMEVAFHAGRKHLPIVTLKRAA